MSEEASVEQRQVAGEGARATPSQYLTFCIADEVYAVDILRVREILRYETVTRVPTTPASIRGVLNLRGSVVPVIDLAVRFGLPESTVSKWTCVIIVEVELDGEQTVMGVMVDSVRQVIELRPEDIEPPPAFGAQVRVSYLQGMARSETGFIMVLDIEPVLASEEMMPIAELREAIAAAEAEAEAESGADQADSSQEQEAEDQQPGQQARAKGKRKGRKKGAAEQE
jgi:purine-binding chemotaxis protein CheW